jgi:hypothetical protein
MVQGVSLSKERFGDFAENKANYRKININFKGCHEMSRTITYQNRDILYCKCGCGTEIHQNGGRRKKQYVNATHRKRGERKRKKLGQNLINDFVAKELYVEFFDRNSAQRIGKVERRLDKGVVVSHSFGVEEFVVDDDIIREIGGV